MKHSQAILLKVLTAAIVECEQEGEKLVNYRTALIGIDTGYWLE